MRITRVDQLPFEAVCIIANGSGTLAHARVTPDFSNYQGTNLAMWIVVGCCADASGPELLEGEGV